MQQRADMDYKYLFLTIILLFSISLNSQIMPSNYGFVGGPDRSTSIPSALYLDASNSSSYSGSGTTWASIGSTSFNTTMLNGLSYVENGDFDYMSFDDANDYVETSKTASNLGFYNSDYSMEAAVRFKDVGSDNFVFGTSTTSTRKGLHVGARNSMVYQGHYSMDGASASGTLSANIWYHIIWTYDVSTSEMKMYLNGSLIETDTGRTSFLGTTNLRIGFAMSDRYANIDLAYAKVFDYVLSSTQISSLYSDYDSVVTRAGYVYGTVNENGTLNLSAPANATITSVSFASYGTPNGSDGNYTIGGCHATNSQTIVENYCVGNNSCSIPAKNAVFGDPCGGTYKRLYVKVYYTH